MSPRKNRLAVSLAYALFGCASAAAMPQASRPGRAGFAPATTTQTATDLDAITVTAQSREQELQDVPIALQVLNEQMLDDVAAEDLSDIDAFVPGLVVNGLQPTQPSIKLRGIETDDFGIGTDPAVGIFVDGVYGGRGGGVLLPFVDVERIEVLKGPQGTLFGRNTAAGAISMITRRPQDEVEARAEAARRQLRQAATPRRCGTCRPATTPRSASTRCSTTATAGSRTAPPARTWTARTTGPRAPAGRCAWATTPPR